MRRAADAPHARQCVDDGRGDGPRDRGRRPLRGHHRRERRPRPHDRDLRAAPGPEAAHREIPGLRLVEPAVPAGAARPGCRRACTARATAAGRACWTLSARSSTTSGTAPMSRSKATRYVQQAVRFGLFHLLQASARAEGRGIASKGLTGTGYDGHIFWDTEGFVLPVLTYTLPHAAADALRWRASTLDLAKERAAQLDLKGAAYPWRTIRGQECSAYWPAGTAALHINADIAMAFERYRDCHRRRFAGEGLRAGGAHRDGAAVAFPRATTTATACGTWTG